MARVLLVEDDPTVAGVIVSYLGRAGHRAKHVTDGQAGLDAIAADVPDIVVLDLMLPRVDGLEVCRQVRQTNVQLPILMLTALGESEDRIAGLEVGADDYVTKPFSPRELVLRIEALLRRSNAAAPANRATAAPNSEVLTAGSLTLDVAARKVTRDGAEIMLTSREFDLLAHLLAHRGVALSRAQLMHEVWGWTFGDQSTVTVHVRRLREKIENDPTKPELLKTVWGVGYRLEPA